MKKSTKIILPALALLVLGTTAAATGTVAWFAANGVVSATGMQVKCATSKNLIISNTLPSSITGENNGRYGSAVSTTNTGVKELSPASTTNKALASSAPGLFTLVNDPTTVDAITGELKSGAKIKSAVAAGSGDSAGDYAVHHFWVANSAKADMDFKVGSLTVTPKGTAAITKALRIAVVYQDQATNKDNDTYQVQIYVTDPNEGQVKVQGLKSVEADGITIKSNAIYDKAGSNALTEEQTANLYGASSSSLGKIAKTENAVSNVSEYVWSTLDVYVWYEGQDPNCTSNNAMTVQSLNIDFTFEAYQTTTTPSQGQGGAGQ